MSIGSILFAAGEGKRLRPITNELAKPALPVLDVPLGAWGLDVLLRIAPPVVVNASHQARALERTLRTTLPGDWDLFDEGAEGYGTAGTVAALAARVEQPIVVYNGDLISDVDVSALVEAHHVSEGGITLAIRLVEHGADVVVAGDRVTRFVDRRREGDVSGGQYIGVAIIDPNVARSIPKTLPLGLGESVFAPLAQQGRLGAYIHDGYALDVGTIDRYLQASRELLEGAAPRPPIPVPGRIVEVDGGHAYVGLGASAAEGSLGPGAVLLAGATVHERARVERAIVWRNETVTPGHDVTDAVWMDGRAIRGSSSRPAP